MIERRAIVAFLMEIGFGNAEATLISSFALQRETLRPDLRLIEVTTRRLYLARYDIGGGADKRAMLHRVELPDPTADLHDHPWDWQSLILEGGYVQEHAGGGLEVLSEGDRNVRHAEDLHSIRKLLAVPTWTLIVVGRRRREWGFQTDHGWVRWTRYPRPIEPEE